MHELRIERADQVAQFADLKRVSIVRLGRGDSDAAIQQFVLSVNDERAAADRFVIAILDSTHLFVKADVVPMLKERLNELMDANTYTFVE